MAHSIMLLKIMPIITNHVKLTVVFQTLFIPTWKAGFIEISRLLVFEEMGR